MHRCPVTKLCPTLCNPMDCSTPGSFVLHCLLESAQIHVHRVGDAIYHRILCHPFSFCLQSFPASGSFPVSSVFSLGGQTNGALASATVLPMNIQDRSPLWLSGLISLQSKGISRVFSKHHTLKASILWHSAFFMVQLWHLCMTTGKTIALTTQNFVSKVMSLFFIMLSRLVISFLPRSKHLLISWLQ